MTFGVFVTLKVLPEAFTKKPSGYQRPQRLWILTFGVLPTPKVFPRAFTKKPSRRP